MAVNDGFLQLHHQIRLTAHRQLFTLHPHACQLLLGSPLSQEIHDRFLKKSKKICLSIDRVQGKDTENAEQTHSQPRHQPVVFRFFRNCFLFFHDIKKDLIYFVVIRCRNFYFFDKFSYFPVKFVHIYSTCSPKASFKSFLPRFKRDFTVPTEIPRTLEISRRERLL